MFPVFILPIRSRSSLTVILFHSLSQSSFYCVSGSFAVVVSFVLNAPFNTSDPHTRIRRLKIKCNRPSHWGPGEQRGRVCVWLSLCLVIWEVTPNGSHSFRSRCLLCHLVGLTCAQAALGRGRWAACLGRFRPLGSVLERPRLSLFLMVIGSMEGESLEPLASLLSRRRFPRALGSHCSDPSSQ